MDIETNTKIGLISRALMLLGEKPAEGEDDDRYGVTVGMDMFNLVYENDALRRDLGRRARAAVGRHWIQDNWQEWRDAWTASG